MKRFSSSIFGLLRIVLFMTLIIGVGDHSNSSTAHAETTVWEFKNPMITGRYSFTATLLQNGQILVTGGANRDTTSMKLAEIYDPDANTWSAIPAMGAERQQHTATLLTNGKVLVVGGARSGSDASSVSASAEIYDPSTQQWTSTGSLHTGRANHFAVLLPSGNVLIGGGYAGPSSLSSAEIYDPETGLWKDAGVIPWAAQQQAATLLLDGSVLVTGGWGSSATDQAAIYHPSTNTWAVVASMHMPRTNHMAVRLDDGRVFVTGFHKEAEIYQPSDNTWTEVPASWSDRLGATATLLPNGQVLIAGGKEGFESAVLNTTEIYDPLTANWVTGSPALQQGRAYHQSILLPNQHVLMIGGSQNGQPMSSVESYGPIQTVISKCTALSLFIFENDSCSIYLYLSKVDVNSSQLRFSVDSSDPSLIPPSNIQIQGSGSARTLTITPAKTNAQSAPTRQGEATLTVTADDGRTTETLHYQVHVIPPPWLVMLYLNGDDGPLQGKEAPRFESIAPSMKRLIQERLPNMPYNPAMRLVVLADFHDTIGDSQIYVRDPAGLTEVTQKILADKSSWPGFTTELNTAMPSTVQAFVNWSKKTYSGSTYTFLSLVDHGGGWAPDLNSDPAGPRGKPTSLSGGWRGMSVDFTGDGVNGQGQSMSTKDTHRALTGLGINVVFFDACFMAMLESAYEIRNDADYLIAGENELFANFPYDTYFSTENLTTLTAPKDLAMQVVENYNSGVNVHENPVHIAAIDLHQLRSGSQADLAAKVDTLAARLIAALPSGSGPIPEDNLILQTIQNAYQESQKFDYDSNLEIRPDREGYVDLADFIHHLDYYQNNLPVDVQQAIDAISKEIVTSKNVVVYNQNTSGVYQGHPMDMFHANGLSIYLPLGEQDNRPTKVDPTQPGCPALPEAQLPYYNDPAQLAFRNDYPHWAALLVRLQQNVTVIRAPVPDGCVTTIARAVAGVDRTPFTSPAPLPIAPAALSGYHIYLPAIVR